MAVFTIKHAFGSERFEGDLPKAKIKARRLRDAYNLRSITIIENGEAVARLTVNDEPEEA
jgi:hypothetical protein